MIEENENTIFLRTGERFVVKDRESGSRAIMPIIVDDEYKVGVVKVDNGIINNVKNRERACDYMLISEGKSEKIVCMIELKGTDSEKEISHAYNQISQSIDRVSEIYLKESDYVIATIAGAQDKTLPSMITKEKRNLCKKLFSRSKIKVKDMDKLVFYVQPDVRTKKAYINKNKRPRVIECHSKNGADIPVPTMLLEALK